MSDAAFDPRSAINLWGRLHNLADAILFFHEWCGDNQLGDGANGTYTVEQLAVAKWDGLDLDDIERRICEAVEAIDLLTLRETEPVIAYTLRGETDADDA